MTLYNVIRSFLETWFPEDVLTSYSGQFEQVSLLITAGIVLFIGYHLVFGWWIKKK